MYRFLQEVVSGYMTGMVKTVTPDVTMAELQKRFEVDDFNAYPVVENEEIIGLITKFDFLRGFSLTPSRIVPHYDDLMKRTVADAMNIEFIYVTPETKLTRVLQLMVDHRVRSIPVIGAERGLVGIISREDVMRALQSCARISS